LAVLASATSPNILECLQSSVSSFSWHYFDALVEGSSKLWQVFSRIIPKLAAFEILLKQKQIEGNIFKTGLIRVEDNTALQ
jgi:hypothetical protein